MNSQQPASTQQTVSSIAPIDPTPLMRSESPTGVILAIAILISMMVSGITGLVRVIMITKPRH